MSRIGKKLIYIPDGVIVAKDAHKITVKGPKGELSWKLHPAFDVDVVGKELSVRPVVFSKKTPALWGLTRALIQNMVDGVTKGFEKKLEIEGIGYRANLEGQNLQFLLG